MWFNLLKITNMKLENSTDNLSEKKASNKNLDYRYCKTGKLRHSDIKSI